MLRAGLLDIDGVLVDSEPWYFKAIQETLSRYGVDIGEGEYVQRWMHDFTGIQRVIDDYKLDVEMEEVGEVRDMIFNGLLGKNVELVPFAVDMLETLKGYPLGVVSSGNSYDVAKRLERFGLVDRFCVNVSGDDVEHKKPHPEPYQKGLDGLRKRPGYADLQASETLVVEDNPQGVESAKTVGCKVIAYPNWFTKDMDFSRADRTVTSLSEITSEFLKDMFSTPET